MAGMTRTLACTAVVLALVCSSALADEPLKVFKLKGKVRLKRGNTEWNLELNTELKPGDEVKTDKDSQMQARSVAEKLWLRFCAGPESRIIAEPGLAFSKIEEPCSGFGLKRGSAYFDVISRTKKSGFTLKIRTKVGVTGVRGTKGLTSFGEKGMRVAVLDADSPVEVEDTEGKLALVKKDETAFIQEWEKAEVAAVGTGGTEAAAQEDAIRKLTALIDGVVVSGTTRVSDSASANADLRAQLDEFIGTAAVRFTNLAGGGKQADVSLDAAATKTALGQILGMPMGKHLVRVEKGIPESARKEIEEFD